MVTDTDDRELDYKDSVMPPLIYPEESNDEESISDSTSAEPTLNTGPPSEKSTKEPILEPDSDALSEPPAPRRENSMGHIAPGDIVQYQKESDSPRFAIIEDCTKESPWGSGGNFTRNGAISTWGRSGAIL